MEKPPEEGDDGVPRHAERPRTRGRSVIRDCPDWFLRYRGGFIGGGISMGASGFSGASTGSDMLLRATGFSMYFFGLPSNVSLHALLQNPYVLPSNVDVSTSSIKVRAIPQTGSTSLTHSGLSIPASLANDIPWYIGYRNPRFPRRRESPPNITIVRNARSYNPPGYGKTPVRGTDGKRHDPGSDLLFQRASP